MRIRTFLAATLVAVGLAAQPRPAAGAVAVDPSQVLGEIKHFAGPYVPTGWAACDGAAVSASRHVALYAVVGAGFGATMSGGQVATFKLPTLPGAPPSASVQPIPVMCVDGYFPADDAPGVYPEYVGQIRLMPTARTLPAGWAPCHGQPLTGDAAAQLGPLMGKADGEPVTLPDLPDQADGRLTWFIGTFGERGLGGYLADVRRWPAAAPVPEGWVPCDGAALSIPQNQALHAIIGTRFGGDGMTTFHVPRLADEGGARWILCTIGQWPSAF